MNVRCGIGDRESNTVERSTWIRRHSGILALGKMGNMHRN